MYFQPSELELWVNFGIAILCFTMIMNSYGPPPLVHCTVRGRAGTAGKQTTFVEITFHLFLFLETWNQEPVQK